MNPQTAIVLTFPQAASPKDLQAAAQQRARARGPLTLGGLLNGLLDELEARGEAVDAIRADLEAMRHAGAGLSAFASAVDRHARALRAAVISPCRDTCQ